MDKKRVGHVSPELAQIILDRADHRCELCGNYEQQYPKTHQIHHIVGRKVEATPDNLIYLCWECHHGKESVEDRPNSGKDLDLKMKLQEKYSKQGKTETEIRKLMGGKIYMESLF